MKLANTKVFEQLYAMKKYLDYMQNSIIYSFKDP